MLQLDVLKVSEKSNDEFFSFYFDSIPAATLTITLKFVDSLKVEQIK